MEYRSPKLLLFSWVRSVDWLIVWSVLLLVLLDIVLIYTSSAIAVKIGLSKNYFITRQTAYIGIGLSVMFALSMCKREMIIKIILIGFSINLLLLSLVKFVGYEFKGAVRWMHMGPLSIQPSEFIKPCFACVVGMICASTLPICWKFIINIAIYCIIALLLLIQPDIGMLVVISGVFIIQLFVLGLPMFWHALLAALAICCAFVAYFIFPHVAQRINAFLDDQESNYQVVKSLLAFQKGGIYGTGPGEGVIKRIIPDAHTDFIFAVAGEEFGMIFCLIMMWLFALIITRVLLHLTKIDDLFVQISATGIISQFALQTIINISVTLNLLPTKGMTLPFISYGGSSMLSMCFGFGILLSLTRKNVRYEQYQFCSLEL
ncbi:Lipid II flippase FtsW [Rickettsiales endosymbiont of Paramecium tredecaurelia]|uniref:FtsW/RodA/SpoVE family cell cycle protein n=1 Tax=Candidatus Sarmatiella mevalonica TaxID=2770581 RepID=UPI0019214076|nr:putative peptidoglycan glycosyltransferase FtsW [Candidatus Sarmatiella mevalonica]MBL3284760.1 Lipid II flippase FtsW [Candidatus Sarmatiella mevalonica]